MKINFLFWGIIGLTSLAVRAEAISPADYAERFQVDMKADIPSLEQLRTQFPSQKIYDTKYDYFWNIDQVFDKEFADTVATYGMRENRLKWYGEEAILEQIKNLPKEYYQYIGPYLHTVPGISEKILELPEIKETKNKFPSRIAPQLEDIENLEFLSPALYFALMPEAWPNTDYNREKIRFRTLPQKNKYNTALVSSLRELVLPQDYAYGAKPQQSVESSLRTISPDAASPLTEKDIQAVVRTWNALAEYGKNIENKSKIIEAGGYLDAWENTQGIGGILPNIKDLVNPCQRLVQKIKMQNMDGEFYNIISAEGFNMEEWAYTCDKTIKAYRVLKMTAPELISVLAYRNNVYENQLRSYPEKTAEKVAIAMQSMVEMYSSPLENVREVKKNQKAVKQALNKLQYRLVFQPLFIK